MHDHENHHCGCGCHHDEDHHHEHHEGCCGAHHHHHDHGACECGCGEERPLPPIEGMTARQQNMLLGLYQRKYLPVACFSLSSTKDESLYSIALAPVYMASPDDSMEAVKALGNELSALEKEGLLTLDYDIPLSGYPYREYKESALYKYFTDTVVDSAAKPGALFDTPTLELGSMALTDRGLALVEDMIKEK